MPKNPLKKMLKIIKTKKMLSSKILRIQKMIRMLKNNKRIQNNKSNNQLVSVKMLKRVENSHRKVHQNNK